ncbi:CHAT domain-containing protein [Mycena epipterygia]|nr:CHAT domain-containing protein [Mycena epipterygia]
MSEAVLIRTDTDRERQVQFVRNSFLEFKASANISNLNTAIYLFQQAAHKSPEGLSQLVRALITHLIYTGDLRSVLAAAGVVSQICQLRPRRSFDIKDILAAMESDFLEVDDDPRDVLDCASAILRDFYGSIDPEALERVINLHHALASLSWDSLHDLSEVLLLRFHINGSAEDLDECIYIARKLYQLLPTRYSCLCAALLTCSDGIFNPSRSLEAIQLCFTRADVDTRAIEFAQAGTELLIDAVQSGNSTHVDSAIEQFQGAECLLSWGHSARPHVLDQLVAALGTRFQQSGTEDDMKEAVRLLRQSLAIQCADPSNYPLRDTSLSGLGSALQSRFEKHGDLRDIQEAVELHRESLQLKPPLHPDRGSSLLRLASATQARFGATGDPQDIDDAVRFHREALTLLPESDPERSACLRNLGVAVRMRFEHTGHHQDIDDAVMRGNLKDIDEATELNRAVLRLRPAPNPYRENSLSNLANVVSIRFHHRSDRHDIDEVIALNIEALALRPDGYPERAKSLNNLANSLNIRYKHIGDPQDLDRAIELDRKALACRATEHPDRPTALSNLSNTVSARFRQREEIWDLDEAVQLQREALSLLPASNVNYGMVLGNLAATLLTSFNHKGDLRDIDEAIQMNRTALKIMSHPHPAHGDALSHLGTALGARFRQSGISRDIDESVQLQRQALAILPPSHHSYSRVLGNLSHTLLVQDIPRQNFPNMEAVEEALRLQREALKFVPPPDSTRGDVLCNLARVLVLSHEKSLNEDYLSEAFSSLPCCVQLGAQTASRYQHSSAIVAYQGAIGLLPQVAALHLDLESRRQSISTMECVNLVSSAATCAIGMKEYAVAVEFLETSRSVFWSQALNLRVPLDRLRSVKPSGSLLAARVAELSKELQGAAFRDTTRDLLNDTHQKIISMEAEGARCRRLNKEWEDTIQSVRNLAGFQDFMRPKDIVALRQAAVHDFSFRAFVTTLPRGQQDLETRLYVTARLFGRREGHDNRNPNDIFRTLLRDLWLCIVKPVFVALGLNKSPIPRRLWWCPTGLFAFLPIHAAGLYGELGADCISDYIISSYTPTLTALLDAPYRTTTPFKMTAVIQPQSEFSPLPATREELDNIRKQVPTQWLTALGDTTDATVDQALSHLLQSSIVHFACHGRQDPANPLNSGLVLSDGRLKVSEIMRRRGGAEEIDLGKTISFAFLSACETAKGDDNVPDEAMHLAATLLFAGFRGLVATMWQMADNDEPKIADSFYEYLFRNCDVNSEPLILPDLTEAAYALHLAVIKLRDEPDIPFTRWVPFLGAYPACCLRVLHTCPASVSTLLILLALPHRQIGIYGVQTLAAFSVPLICADGPFHSLDAPVFTLNPDALRRTWRVHLKPVCASLSSINIRNATADIFTPLTDEVKSLLSAAASEVSALAGRPMSMILSSKGCECSSISSESHGVLSVPDIAQLLTLVLSGASVTETHAVFAACKWSLGDVLTAVESTPAADTISPLLCDATTGLATLLSTASPIVDGLLGAVTPLVSALTTDAVRPDQDTPLIKSE